MSEIKEYYKSILSNYLENISKEEVVEKKYDIPELNRKGFGMFESCWLIR